MARLGGVLLAIFSCAASAAVAQPLSAVVDRYCVTCHSARFAESKIELDNVDAARPWIQPDLWERVLRQLRAGTMPPTDTPRPDAKSYEALIEQLASALDRGDAHPPRRVADVEVAARVAKLLWSAAPDAELLDAARKGRLHDPAVLESQVRRMLGAPKAEALVRGFFEHWLGLDQLPSMPADAAAFPEFDPDLRQSMLRETELFLESQLRDDRPAVDLWTAKYTYVNERLAKLYGIPNVTGREFRRVTLPDSARAGLLGQASILTITSVLTKHAAVDAPSTSPAARGKWIRAHFFGIPSPHPIPGIPPLEKGILLSAQLRTLPDPSCNSCHSNFFPMGYALENFDMLGRWRSEADGYPIDVSGAIADGTEFEGPAQLRQVLLARQDAFLNTITERLLAYAIGADAAPMPAVRTILREAPSARWSYLLAAVARTAASIAPTTVSSHRGSPARVAGSPPASK